MARRISISQLKSQLRQAQSKQRQAINKYNQQVRKVNSAINQYNSKARAHNARVRANQQRLKSELNRLSSRSTSTRTVTYRVSVRTVLDAYTRYESQVGPEPADPRHAEWLDLAERESAKARIARPLRTHSSTNRRRMSLLSIRNKPKSKINSAPSRPISTSGGVARSSR